MRCKIGNAEPRAVASGCYEQLTHHEPAYERCDEMIGTAEPRALASGCYEQHPWRLGMLNAGIHSLPRAVLQLVPLFIQDVRYRIP